MPEKGILSTKKFRANICGLLYVFERNK